MSFHFHYYLRQPEISIQFRLRYLERTGEAYASEEPYLLYKASLQVLIHLECK